jgi:hypothetical protein
MDSRIEDTVVEISSHVFPEENIDDHARNTFCYFLPLQKRNHLPIKVLKFTTHIQNMHVLCRQHWFVERAEFQYIYPIHPIIFLLASTMHGHKISKTMKTFY